MAVTVYILCAATSLLCAVLLWRGYRKTNGRLLLWSALCFVMLFINNLLLCIDWYVGPDVTKLAGVQFALLRALAGSVGLLILLCGLIWDSE